MPTCCSTASLEPLTEEGAVRQPREPVVERLMVQPLLALAHLAQQVEVLQQRQELTEDDERCHHDEAVGLGGADAGAGGLLDDHEKPGRWRAAGRAGP